MADAGFAIPAGEASPASALARLRGLVSADMDRVEALIAERMEAGTALIPRLGGHIARAGGKRLRPILTLTSARLCGSSGECPASLAAAVELFHMVSLLHDDVVDTSALRRGAASANALWGNKASVLVGDFLLGRALQLMLEAGPPEAVELFAGVTSVMVDGELRQMRDVGSPDIGAEACLEAVSKKTASLFAACCRLGAVSAGASRDAEAALEAYGRNLGIAFQLVDDALDYSGREAELGKSVGDDFAGGKVTLPVVLAFERGDGEERAFWRRTLEAGDRRPGDFGRALAVMDRRGALAETWALAHARVEEAVESLGFFPEGAVRSALGGFAAFCVERRH